MKLHAKQICLVWPQTKVTKITMRQQNVCGHYRSLQILFRQTNVKLPITAEALIMTNQNKQFIFKCPSNLFPPVSKIHFSADFCDQFNALFFL